MWIIFLSSIKTYRYETSTAVSIYTNIYQLALCLWTAPGTWPMSVADIRKELCESDTGNFSNAQLAEESTRILKLFRVLNLGTEERPTKRRKTLPDTSDINRTIYERLMMVLNGSSQDSPVFNLSNLHNIME
jgi:serine/threonine-protein kinase ATR